MRYDPRQVVNYINRLAPRERLLVGVAAVSVVAISLYSFVWDPLQTNRAQLAKRIATKEKDLIEVQKQRDTYLDLRRQLDANQASIAPKDPGFSLFAYVDNVIAQAVGREHITSMNPSDKSLTAEFQETMVEIKLTQISLEQLVDLLYRVEKGDHPLRFSRLQVKKRANDIRNFDVTATVSVLNVANS